MSSLTMQPDRFQRSLLGATLLALAVATECWAEAPPTRAHLIDVGQGVAAPAAAAVATPSQPVAGALKPQVLAPWPLCEASAALPAPWGEQLVLIADNERDDQLFVFTVENGKLAAKKVWQMPAKQRPNDIEALARLGREVVLVGSHSRNNQCETRENRQRLRRLTVRQDGTLEEAGFLDSAAAWKRAMEGGGAPCLATLFVQPAPAGAATVCEALIAAEKAAAKKGEPCKVLNIEGAFGTADGRLWLGLRSPLAGQRAVLLRLVPGFTELRFDQVALLGLEGRGIRELALAGEQLIGIAGPTLDADEPFLLFRAAAPAVLAGGEPAVEILRRDLLSSSEGLLLRNGRAYILLDGDADKDKNQCTVPARWYAVDLPL
jgi:hypothetical protein